MHGTILWVGRVGGLAPAGYLSGSLTRMVPPSRLATVGGLQPHTGDYHVSIRTRRVRAHCFHFK